MIPFWIRETQLDLAEKYLGMDIAEEPLKSNQGFWVNVFQEDAGLNPGDAWCMAFIYHCHLRACRMQRRENAMLKKTGWCKGQWLFAVENPKLSIIQAADILAGQEMPRGSIWIRYGDDGCGHTGFVVDHDTEHNVLKSIEGNAGDRVKVNEYVISSIDGFKGVIY